MINKLYIFLLCLFLCACNQKEDRLTQDFDRFYVHVLASNYDDAISMMDKESEELLERLTAPINQNIDSILSIGQRYRIPFLLTEYFAFRGEQTKAGNLSNAFFSYLGMHDASVFSYTNGYYIERSKIKRAAESSIPIIKEEMTRSKRNWTKWKGNDQSGYAFDLIYTLQLFENNRKRYFETIKSNYPDLKNDEEFLRQYHWQNSGANSVKFDRDQEELATFMKAGRAKIIESYKARGLVE